MGRKSPPHLHPTQLSPQVHLLPTCQHVHLQCLFTLQSCIWAFTQASPMGALHLPGAGMGSTSQSKTGLKSLGHVLQCSDCPHDGTRIQAHIAGPVIPLLCLFSTPVSCLCLHPPWFSSIKQPGSCLWVSCTGRLVNHHENTGCTPSAAAR